MCKCDSVHDAHYTYGKIPNFERNINVISTEYVSIKMQITLTCKTIFQLSLFWIFSWIYFKIEFYSSKHPKLKNKFKEKSIFSLFHCMCSFHLIFYWLHFQNGFDHWMEFTTCYINKLQISYKHFSRFAKTNIWLQWVMWASWLQNKKLCTKTFQNQDEIKSVLRL